MTSEGPSFRDEYVRGPDGKPILDRYGRPVRRRPAQRRPRTSGTGASGTGTSAAPGTPPRPGQPRVYPPQRPQVSRPEPTRYEPVPAVRPSTSNQQPGRVGQARQQGAYLAPSPQPQRRMPRVRVRPSGCLSGAVWALVIALVLALASIIWVDTKLNRTDAFPSQHVANTAGTNWLLVGSDSREGLTDEEAARLGTGGDIGSMRTDTIMVLHLPLTGKATLMSIPRDSYVNIPGYGQDKINAAFSVGGAPLLTQTVEQATGLRINHYAEIGMAGLANVVDSVGGIQVCPTEAIDDPLANLNIQAGCQTVDGPTALGYVRTRHTANGDLDRVARQREFFAALVDKITSASTIANPFRFWPTINSIAGSFTVNKNDHAWHLLRVGLAMRGGVDTVTVPVGGFEDTDVGSVVLWDDTAAQQLFDSLK